MQIRHSPLFSVSFRHDYFPQGGCPVVGLIPTPETTELMQRLNIRMKGENFGASFYYRDGDPPTGHSLLTNEPIGLSFILRTTDPRFRNYTRPETGKTDTDPIFLTNLGSGGLSEGLATDLPANWQPGDLGLLTVFVGNTGSGSRILTNGVVTPEEYTITFAVRETFWRYYLIDAGERSYEIFQLVDNASGEVVAVTGHPPETKTLPDGSEAILLSAPSSLPLHQRPAARFTLHMREKNAGQSAPVKIPLPSPDAERISADAADGPYYSDLYIYI